MLLVTARVSLRAALGTVGADAVTDLPAYGTRAVHLVEPSERIVNGAGRVGPAKESAHLPASTVHLHSPQA
jgi:hypothetical protein